MIMLPELVNARGRWRHLQHMGGRRSALQPEVPTPRWAVAVVPAQQYNKGA